MNIQISKERAVGSKKKGLALGLAAVLASTSLLGWHQQSQPRRPFRGRTAGSSSRATGTATPRSTP